MASSLPTTRRAVRRKDDYTKGTPKTKIVTEPVPSPLPATSVLIKVHAVALNYRDSNIANGGNPWPVTPNGILGNDAAGEIIAVGEQVKNFKVGDRVAPNTDTANITGRETGRSWLAANEDGVLADYIVYDERVIAKLPTYLSWIQASIIPCAGVTAWSSLLGVSIGQSVLIQGTGGVSLFALKLARAAGLKVILTSSSDEKLKAISDKFPNPPLLTVNYKKTPEWHEEVLKLTDGVGVDCVVEVGGAGTFTKSMKSTRRGGIISVVGYLTKDDFNLPEFLPLIIDRRITVRGINAGSVQDMADLCDALTANQMIFEDIIDSVEPFEKAEEAVEKVWQAQVVGKLVLDITGQKS